MAYVESGRVDQKRRTRDALVAAARDIVAQGHTPTVEAAASAAAVSRTTAYRYFANQRQLLAAAHPETASTSLLPEDAPDDAAARLETVIRRFTDTIAETERQQRTMLRLSLEPHSDVLPLRQGRAIGWIGEALEPLSDELDEDALRSLVMAIRSATGIEALVWLRDVAGLPKAEALALMRWSAQALMASAVAGPAPPTGESRASAGIS
jgi:AcrR family transcriptional regulator